MPIYSITGPDGTKYRIPGPEGATDEEVRQQVQQQIQPQNSESQEAPAQQPPAPSEAPEMSWSDVGASAIKNVGPSAVKFGRDILQPFIDPIGTGENLLNLGAGVLEKTGLKADTGKSKYADAVGQFLMDRYGGMKQFKQTLATDPVGAASDISIPFTGGGALAAKAPGLLGHAGEAAALAGRVIDPLNIPMQGAKLAGKGAAAAIGSKLGTGTGSEALRTAASAGAEGGSRARAFQESLRGGVPLEQTLAEARQAIQQMKQQRGAEYVSGMSGVRADNTILNFDKIDNAMADIEKVKNFKGQELSPSSLEIRYKIADEIEHWRALDPAEFHTAEGFDALKQKIGDLRDSTKYGTPERLAADKAYKALRQTVIDQAPAYAKVMSGYEYATDIIKSIEKELIGNPNASVDTALRKLQTVLKDNVSGGFSRRRQLAEYLKNAGAPHLLERLSGQALSQWAPKGFGKIIGTELLMGGGAFLGAGFPGVAAAGVAALPFMSPRFAGEAAYYAGAASRLPGRALGMGEFQTGRLAGQLNPREMIRHDAAAALQDKSGLTAGQINELRAVANGKAPVDTAMRVKTLLEFRQKKLDAQANARPYGGPQ